MLKAGLMPSLSGTWSARVFLLIGSGVVASAQVGKAIISIPLIREDLALGGTASMPPSSTARGRPSRRSGPRWESVPVSWSADWVAAGR